MNLKHHGFTVTPICISTMFSAEEDLFVCFYSTAEVVSKLYGIALTRLCDI